MIALILGVLGLLLSIVALVLALRARALARGMARDFEAIVEALDEGPATPAPVERESVRDYTVLEDVGKALAARARSAAS